MLRVVRLLVVALWLAPAACSSQESGSEAVAAHGDEAKPAAAEPARQPAPDFTLPDLKGQSISLAGLRGKTVVIDFWATWCPPCVFQIPILNDFYAANRGKGVEVLGVSVDVDGEKVVAPYAEKNDIQYPVLLGDESLARKFGAPGFPALIVVAPDGTIASVHVGLIEQDELEAAVADLVPRSSS